MYICNSDYPSIERPALQKSISPRPWVISNKFNMFKIISIAMKSLYLQYFFTKRKFNCNGFKNKKNYKLVPVMNHLRKCPSKNMERI